MKASQLKGRAVVTLSDAAKVGQISDVLFDAEYRRVLGFRVKQGAFSQTEAFSRENATAIGTDAITVPGPDVINLEDRIADLAGATATGQAQGTKVVTEGGALIGMVSDLEIDDEARFVTAYELSAPLWDRLRGREPRIGAHEVLRLGEGGIMLVSNATADNLTQKEPQA